MQSLIDLWKTTVGKIAILGGGSILGLLSLCFTCAICGTIFGDDSNRPIEATRNIVSFSTEQPTSSPTATLKSTSTPQPTITPLPMVDAPEQIPTSMPEPVNNTEEELSPLVITGDSNINLRNGPGTEYDIVGILSAGQRLEVVGRNPDSTWWQVDAPGGLCWIAASVATTNSIDDTTIPVVEVPPLPSNTIASTDTPMPTHSPTSTDIPVQPTDAPVPQVGPPPGSEILAGGVWRCPSDTSGAAYVGSDESDKYHYLDCRWADKINDENRICFSSKDAAIAYGYVSCGTCNP